MKVLFNSVSIWLAFRYYCEILKESQVKKREKSQCILYGTERK